MQQQQTAATRVAASPESTGSEGQTRGELLQTAWKAALTAGAAQTLLATPAFAEVWTNMKMHDNIRKT